MSQISDELLLAYLDGQLGAPQAQTVERMVSSDRDLRVRLQRLETTQAYLTQTFQTLARRTRASLERPRSYLGNAAQTQPRPAQAQTAASTISSGNHGSDHMAMPSRGSATRKVLLKALMISIIAAAIGYGAAKWIEATSDTSINKIVARVPPPASQWAGEIARLHSFFTEASVSSEPGSQSNRDFVELQLSRIIGRSLTIPDFNEHDLTFQRGQVLAYRGTKMMQLSYSGEDAGLVALYVMPGRQEREISVFQHEKVTSVTWGRESVRYVLAGTLPENSLRALAAVAMAQSANP